MSPLARRLTIVGLGAALTAATWSPALLGSYGHYLIGTVAAFAIAVLAMTMLASLSGIWSLGHTAFMAIGAYLAGILSLHGVPVEAILAVAVPAAGALGFLLGLSAGRFSVLYFGLLTLALAMASNEVIGQWASVTGGDQGMQLTKGYVALAAWTIDLKAAVPLAIALATAVFLVGDIITHGARGRRWLAVKSQRTASLAIGLRPHIENALALALSAAIASVAGVVAAFEIGYLDPQGFSLDVGVTLIVATVIGGVGSFVGAVFGALFIILVPELARDLPAVSAFVYGAATIVILLFLHRGVVPSLAQFLRRGRTAARPTVPARQVLSEQAIAETIALLVPPADRVLVMENVTVEFGGLKALDGVGLRLEPGQVLGLIGPNGAGKTTLLNVLSGFVAPVRSSKIMIGNSNLTRLRPYDRLGLGIGRTFQHAELFGELTVAQTLGTVAQLALPLRKRAGLALSAPDAVAGRLLDALELRPHADSLPGELSFGVQKVVDIARMLAAGASVIAMDEPFSGLDAHERDEVRACLHGLRRAGASILIIDHAVQEVLSIADKVLVLDFGRTLASGSPAEIRRDPEVMRAYFGTIAPAEAPYA